MIRSAATIALAALVAFMAPAAFAAEEAFVELGTPEPVSPCTVDIPVLVSTPSNIDFFQFTINYNSSCARFISASLGSAASGFVLQRVVDSTGTTDFPIGPTPTTFDRHVVVQATNITGSFSGNLQRVAVLHFNRVGPTGSCHFDWDLSLVNGQYATFLGRTTGIDIVNSPPGTIGSDGIITTGNGVKVLGNAHYYDVDSNKIANVHMAIYQGGPPIIQGTTTNGDYEISGLANGTTAVAAHRITDNDHKISIGGHDAILMYRMAAGSLTPTRDQLRAADINMSGGAVDITDADLVSKWLAFQPAPGVAKWTFDLEHKGTVVPDSIVFTMNCADDTVAVKGFFRGDVDSTWALRTPKAERPISLAMSMSAQNWDGDVVTVDLSGDETGQSFESMIYSLEYDATAFEYLGAVKSSQTAGAVLVDNGTETGRIHGVLLGVNQNIGANGAILTLRFRAKSATSSSHLTFTRLRLDDRPAADAPEIVLSRGGATTDALPKHYALSSAPNPFNPSTRITYSIPENAGTVAVSVRVYDIAGRLVRDLVSGERAPGQYGVTWDGRDANGDGASTGIYLIRMQAGAWAGVEKVSLLK